MMQHDVPWLHSAHRSSVKSEEMAEHPLCVPLAETSPQGTFVASADGSATANVESPGSHEQHGSESESATACGAAAALEHSDRGVPEVNSRADTNFVNSSIPAAAWPFIARKAPGVPTPRVRKWARKSQHPQKAPEPILYDYGPETCASFSSPSPAVKKGGRKRKAEVSFDGAIKAPTFSGSPAASLNEPTTKFHRHGVNNVCSVCGTTQTTLWRRPAGSNVIYCNACGLRHKRHSNR